MAKPIVSTQYIVLQKTLYLESSLIISGLSPTYGKLDFMIKGERRISKKKSPEVDLFRIFNVEFFEKHSSIINPILMECVNNYDRISNFPERVVELFNLSSFLLKNEHYALPCPLVYCATLKHLERTINKEEPLTVGVKLVYLHESGLLPHNLTYSNSNDEFKARATIKILLDYALGKSEKLSLPFNSAFLNKLYNWIEALCFEHHLQ